MPHKSGFAVVGIRLAVALLIFAGLFSPISDLNFHQAVMLGTPLSGLLDVALLIGILSLLIRKSRCPVKRKVYSILAALCSLCILLDRSFLLHADWSLLLGSWRAFLTALWVGVALSLCLNALLCLLADWFAREAGQHTPTLKHGAGGGELLAFCKFMALILLCWLPHIIMQAPGAIETTAGQQIRQCFGELPYSRDNPIFHTLWLKLVLKGTLRLGLGDSMAVMAVSLSQLLPLAAALAWTLCIVKRLPLNPRFASVLLWFYCLCPLFPLYGLFIVKDVPFAVAVLLLTCVITEITLRRAAFFTSWLNCAVLVVIGACVCLLRNMAVVLYGLSVAAVFFAVGLDARARLRLCACVFTTLALYGGFILAADARLHPDTLDTRQAENRSLQCQMVARVVKYHERELSTSEIQTIDACIPVAGLGSRYHPEVSDPVKDTWRAGVTAAQKQAFDLLIPALMLRYPADCSQAALQMAIPYVTPGDIGRFRAIFDCGFSNIEALYPVFNPKHLFPTPVFRATLDFFQREPLINFFCCGGAYAWLLIGSVALLIARRRKRLMACAIPALLVLVGCLFSPVAGYVRYALPYMFAAPFLTLLTVYGLTQPEEKQRKAA